MSDYSSQYVFPFAEGKKEFKICKCFNPYYFFSYKTQKYNWNSKKNNLKLFSNWSLLKFYKIVLLIYNFTENAKAKFH